jgi:hypothetical protein
MAFDLGIALGSAGETALDTYTKLNREGRDIEKARREKEQFEWQRKEQQQKQAAEQAYLNTLGNSDQVKEQVIPGTEGVGDQGPTIKREAIPYNDQQKQLDFQEQLRSTNASPLYAMQLQQAGLGIKGLQRTEARAEAEDQFSKWHQDSIARIQKDPVAWVNENLDAYNKAAKGSHLDDGLTAKVVPSADGGASLVRTDSKGKVVDSTPINSQTAMSAMQDLSFAKYQALPGKFKEGAELGFKKEEVNLKGKQVAIEERGVKVKEDLVPSEKAKNFAAAYASSQAGSYYGAHAKTIGDENTRKQDLYDTQKLYAEKIASLDTKDPQYQTKKYEIAQQGEAALAMKSGDFSKIAAGTPMGRAITSFHEAEKAYNEGKRADKPNLVEILGANGYAPEIVKNTIQKKIDGLIAAGKPEQAETELQKFNAQFKYTPIEMKNVSPVTPTAIPVKPTANVVPQTDGTIRGYNAPGYSAQGAALKNIDELKNRLETATTPVQKNNIAIQLKKEQDAYNRNYK